MRFTKLAPALDHQLNKKLVLLKFKGILNHFGA